ncbi:MAG TPA: succinate dehydrogenase iron-sulfur subunit [Rhabdochlamydiaceae bacterium]|jgi:succinate dehydrogenase / fumarate reductase iron-sulfur subunit
MDSANHKKFILRIYRGEPEKQYWEEFELPLRPFLNITSALMDIQKNPINRKKQKVTPVAWEQGCLEEVCGSCSMLINGRPRQGCTALIEQLLQATGSHTVTLAPMTKFPLVKDLVVDRARMFENLKKVNAWIDVDDALDPGFGPKISPILQDAMYVLSTCMTCGCCTEACPQINAHSAFIGPAAISQARLFNAHPVGKLMKHKRLRPLMEEGGVSDCGDAQNCVAVCPKEIPLTESIAVMERQVVKQALHDMVSLPDAE